MFKSVKKTWCEFFQKCRDPVEILPAEAMENIFSYLRGYQILKLSLINKAWYKFIAKSPVCMNKIRIHITEFFLTQKRVFEISDILRMLEGGRNYKHLSIACIKTYDYKTQQFSPQHKLLMALYQWKSISLCNHHFSDELELINFLGFVEPFITELELRSVFIENFLQVCETNFKFPKLKTLHLVNVNNFIYEEPFKNVYKLEEFAVATEPFPPSQDHSEQIKERAAGIAMILLNNRRIASLELFIEQKDFDCMFIYGQFVSKIQFKLTNLGLGRFRKMPQENANQFQLKNFVKFLRLHTNTLKEIYLPECLGKDVMEVVFNEMENLKNLTIHDSECSDHYTTITESMMLIPNNSIEILNIQTKSAKYSGIVSTFVRKLPNLKKLTTGIVNQPLFNVLTENSHALESIHVDFFTATSTPQNSTLENLKNMSITIQSNNDLLEVLEKKEKLTHFDEVFMTATKRLNCRWDVNSKSFYRC
jgi:hypothetical protein